MKLLSLEHHFSVEATEVEHGAKLVRFHCFGGIVMADERKTPQRLVLRSCECHRLEDQTWSLAYEISLPGIRRKVQASGGKTKNHVGFEPTRASSLRLAR